MCFKITCQIWQEKMDLFCQEKKSILGTLWQNYQENTIKLLYLTKIFATLTLGIITVWESNFLPEAAQIN